MLASWSKDLQYNSCILSFYRKAERKINFEQFRKAVMLAAEIKYPGDADCVKKLEGKIISGAGPGSSSPSAVSLQLNFEAQK